MDILALKVRSFVIKTTHLGADIKYLINILALTDKALGHRPLWGFF